ncbi:MAG: hypothetical protein ACI9MR_003886 [Myxococcota bacterium]|jgi:hypothetical protein
MRLTPARTLARTGLLTVLTWMFWVAPSTAAGPGDDPVEVASGQVCEPLSEQIDAYKALRATSLDLRGTLPTMEEYAAVEADPEMSSDLVDEWLQSDAFAERAVRIHRDLLWNNVDDLILVNTRGRLSARGGLYFRGGGQASRYRILNVECNDEPAQYNADGSFVFTDMPDGSLREGWIWVNPFWAPDTQIKVCGLDAQDAATSPTGTDCATVEGLSDVGCGCGPNMRRCTTTAAERLVRTALAEEIEHRIRDVVERDASYLELLTGDKAYFNGPLVHYWKYQTAFPRMAVSPAPIPLERLPDLEFTDVDTWVAVEMGPQHSGILTSTAYLLRFQTNRARANRFFNAFVCQPFNAPSGGVPVADEAAQTEPDLQVRHGCEYCHALLEPAASHWGRWGERGATYLSPIDHPPFDAECELCATSGLPCSARCNGSYTVKSLDPKEDAFIGWLKPYTFRRPEHRVFVEEGPKYLVYSTIVDGRLPMCVARSTAERFLGRTLDDDTDEAWLADVAREFVASGYRYRAVVKAVLEHPSYRRVR